MTIFWINLTLVYFFSFFTRYFSRSISSINLVSNKITVIATALCLVLVSGLRSNIGDTYYYKHSYKTGNFTWESIKSQKDIGFGVLQLILKKISDDPQIMIFTTALITNVLIIVILYNYSKIFELSTYVYITCGLYLVSMNGIRQFLASAIIFTGTKFLINGNWKSYILLVLFASTFHQSALILIPIYFLVRFKAWSKYTFILLFISVVIVILFNQFSNVLFSVIEDTQYGLYKNFDAGGANIIRVVVNAMPLLLAFLGRDKIKNIIPNSDYIVNMALLGFTFMVISIQNWIFARFSIYFGLYQLILLSWVVKAFRKKDQKLIYFAILICYFVFYYYESVISLYIQYKSDYL